MDAGGELTFHVHRPAAVQHTVGNLPARVARPRGGIGYADGVHMRVKQDARARADLQCPGHGADTVYRNVEPQSPELLAD